MREEEPFSFSSSQLDEILLWAERPWVPSSLAGEGQDEGMHGTSSAGRPLTLSLSHEGRGDPVCTERTLLALRIVENSGLGITRTLQLFRHVVAAQYPAR